MATGNEFLDALNEELKEKGFKTQAMKPVFRGPNLSAIPGFIRFIQLITKTHWRS